MKVILVMAVVLLAAFGCGKKETEEDQATFTAKNLEGLWSVACTPAQLGQLSGYRIAAIQITAAGGFLYENTHYEDAACTIKLYDESSKGSFALGDAVDAESKKITLTGTEGSGTPRHDGTVTAFNAGACGFNDWAKDATKDLMGTGCIGWSEATATDAVNLVTTEAGQTQMQVYSLSGDGTKNRYTGDDFIKN